MFSVSKNQISMKTIGLKFSQLLSFRAEGDAPPPFYGQPDHKISVFFTTPLREAVKNYLADFFC